MYTRIKFYSTTLKKEVDKHLATQEQKNGYFTDLGIIEKNGMTYKSNLPMQEVLWKLCSYFDQLVTNTIQFGEFGLINKNGQGNADTPFSNNYGVGNKQVWANAFIAQYDNETHEALNSQ